jgi:hypothetical protein
MRKEENPNEADRKRIGKICNFEPIEKEFETRNEFINQVDGMIKQRYFHESVLLCSRSVMSYFWSCISCLGLCICRVSLSQVLSVFFLVPYFASYSLSCRDLFSLLVGLVVFVSRLGVFFCHKFVSYVSVLFRIGILFS